MVMPTFHPAYLLRVPEKKREAWEDMKKVREYLNTLAN
jgi:DNA polymerase